MELAIDTYKRSQAVSYRSPSSRRFFFNKAKRLSNLAHRIHEGRLFIPDIVAALREAADELIDLGNILLLTDRCYQLLQDLTWIKSRELPPRTSPGTSMRRAAGTSTPPTRSTAICAGPTWCGPPRSCGAAA
jgi:hypothetical protein